MTTCEKKSKDLRMQARTNSKMDFKKVRPLSRINSKKASDICIQQNNENSDEMEFALV